MGEKARALISYVTFYDIQTGLYTFIATLTEKSAAGNYAPVISQIIPFFIPLLGQTRPYAITLMVFRFILLTWILLIIIFTLLKRKTMKEVLSLQTLKDIFYMVVIFSL